jgi:hypothetical protein
MNRAAYRPGSSKGRPDPLLAAASAVSVSFPLLDRSGLMHRSFWESRLRRSANNAGSEPPQPTESPDVSEKSDASRGARICYLHAACENCSCRRNNINACNNMKNLLASV